jgi:two-component system sensor kinase FixL
MTLRQPEHNSVTPHPTIDAIHTDPVELESDLSLVRQKIALLDRLIAIEELATTIAQEINQPLAAISNYIQGSVRRLENGNVNEAELLNALKQAAKQSERTTVILSELKNLLRKKTFFYESVCLNTLINESIALIHYEIPEWPLTIFFRPNHEMPNLLLDKIHIQQVILNIARNAIQRMRAANTQAPQLTIEISLKKNNALAVIISDNGPDVSAEKLHELFHPTLPSENTLLGLGLGVSRSIVEAHGGELEIKSLQQQGMCCKFSLARNILSPNSAKAMT